MSSSSSDLRLFGIDLGVLWQDLRKPWQNMHAWPVFAWLTPVVPVQLEQADGGAKPAPRNVVLGERDKKRKPTRGKTDA